MYEPFNDDYTYLPLCKREYSHIGQPEEVSVNTNPFLIHQQEHEGPYTQHRSQQQQQQQQPEVFTPKRIKQEDKALPPTCLFTNATSPLAHLDLDSIFNYANFQQLPPHKQDELTKLLPSPDTTTYLTPTSGHNVAYPFSCSSSATSSSTSLSSDEIFAHPHPTSIHPSFFSPTENPVFWSALDDWQSMLASGQLAIQKEMPSAHPLQEPQSASSSSSSSFSPTPFKDDAFEVYWGELSDKEKMHNVAGDSKSITLKDMCRKGLIRENDFLVYKRNFSACKVIVSKTIKVIRCDGSLGLSILLDDQVYEDFETPTALETKILDHHGKVARDKRPNGNAFKSIRLVRNGKDLGRLFDIRKDAFGS